MVISIKGIAGKKSEITFTRHFDWSRIATSQKWPSIIEVCFPISFRLESSVKTEVTAKNNEAEMSSKDEMKDHDALYRTGRRVAVYHDRQFDQEDQSRFQLEVVHACHSSEWEDAAVVEVGGLEGSGGRLEADDVLERAIGCALSLEGLRTLYFSSGGPFFNA
jgi:hypothetical protein